MTLRKTTIDVPFVGGLNQGANAKGLVPPELITLNNGRYLKDRSIDKCLGFTRLGSPTTGSSTTSLIGLTTWKDELLRFKPTSLESWAAADSSWVTKGSTFTGRSRLIQVSGSPTAGTDIDAIEQDGIRVVTWSEGSVTYYSVFDVETGNIITNKATLTSTAGTTSRPRLVSITNNVYIFFNGGSNNLKFLRIPSVNPTSTTTTTIYSTLSGTSFDACSIGDQMFVAFLSSATSDIQISRLNSEGTVTATTNTGSGATDLTCENAGGSVGVSWGSQIRTYTTDLVVIVTGALGAGPAITKRTFNSSAFLLGTSGTEVHVWNAVTRAYIGPLVLGATLASKANSGKVALLYSSTLQSTYFIAFAGPSGGAGPIIIGKVAAGQAGAVGTRLTNFAATGSDDVTLFGIFKKGRIESANGTLFAALLPQMCLFSVDTAEAYQTTQAGENLLIAGGTLKSYDGTSVTEYGFHLYPESITPVASNTADGAIPNGVYLIQALYEWTDARGVRHQSAPSPASSITLSGGDDTITVTIPALTLTDKTSYYSNVDRADIKIRVFMTTNGGTVPYYAGQTDNPDITSATTATVTLKADPSTLTSNEIIYTSGGALENIAAPSHSYAFIHDNRIVLCGLEDPNQVAFSKDIKPLTGVGFNEDLVMNLDPIGGDCVAGASLENVMILFKETAIYAVSGSGPNDLGANSTFSPPFLVSNSVGCRDPKSVCATPQGVYFMSRKGVYFLSRGLELSYIGRPVQDYNSDTIIATNIYPDAEEIRFVNGAGKTLIYHYGFSRWSTQDSLDAVDATVWNNTYVYATDTKVLIETAGTYLLDGSYVPLTVRSGWIRLGAMLGYQRAYRLGLLGTYYSNNNFRIKVYFNYSDIVKEDTTVTAADLVNTSVYGDGAVYGDDAYYGGSAEDETYQLRHSFANQKCSALSVEISDGTAGQSNSGQGFSLQGLSLLLGGKGGIFKQSNTRTV